MSALRLIDAPRCPYCARVRIALAEKGIAYETVVIDLADRPAWVYELNPIGKVPVLERDGWVLPESAVINEYLEEALPRAAAPARGSRTQRATARLLIFRHDDFTDPVLRPAAQGGRRGGCVRGRARGARRDSSPGCPISPGRRSASPTSPTSPG